MGYVKRFLKQKMLFIAASVTLFVPLLQVISWDGFYTVVINTNIFVKCNRKIGTGSFEAN
jgi:hypothetical protein